MKQVQSRGFSCIFYLRLLTIQFFGPILLDQNQRRQYALNLFNTLLTPILTIGVVIDVIALLFEAPIQHIQRLEM